MPKKKIVLGYLAYPFCIASYFRHELEKRPDVELFTVGAYHGDHIPWNGGMRIPLKYVKPVNLPLPPTLNYPRWEMIKDKIPWTPDLILCVDAGFFISGVQDIPYAIVATDPHVLNYDRQREIAKLFNMQKAYLKEGDVWLPYACSPDHHYAMSGVEKTNDASLIGLHYPQRNALVGALRAKGHKILYEIGSIFDEYREKNNSATIGLNWSSAQDITARVFEIMAMRQVPVINRLPHLDELGLIEQKHYIGFDSVQDAVEKVEWALSYPDFADAIALNAHNLVHEKHTYKIRVQQIFDEMGL